MRKNSAASRRKPTDVLPHVLHLPRPFSRSLTGLAVRRCNNTMPDWDRVATITLLIPEWRTLLPSSKPCPPRLWSLPPHPNPVFEAYAQVGISCSVHQCVCVCVYSGAEVCGTKTGSRLHTIICSAFWTNSYSRSISDTNDPIAHAIVMHKHTHTYGHTSLGFS